ncbi:hypothetical protein RhiirB3_455863, partial [Rhizophagus irregularis]
MKKNARISSPNSCDSGIKPPRKWKNFAEIGFKVSNIQTEATVDGIKGFFATHGSVYRVPEKLMTLKILNVQLELLISYSSTPVPAYPFWNKSLRFHGRVLQVDYQKYIRSSDTFYSYPAESLELGDYLLPAEINFKDIINDIYSELYVSQQRSRGSITIENKYSAKCWVLHNISCQKSKDKFNWCIDDFWKRITKDDKMPHFHKNNEQP